MKITKWIRFTEKGYTNNRKEKMGDEDIVIEMFIEEEKITHLNIKYQDNEYNHDVGEHVIVEDKLLNLGVYIAFLFLNENNIIELPYGELSYDYTDLSRMLKNQVNLYLNKLLTKNPVLSQLLIYCVGFLYSLSSEISPFDIIDEMKRYIDYKFGELEMGLDDQKIQLDRYSEACTKTIISDVNSKIKEFIRKEVQKYAK